ncbi:MAG: PQQ-dependent sugar dehydrogenase [Acidimicrobiia bacterium]|nr:PQQ-dependent sugar dehydrogenase [Acidimicrobiia bacterium]
MACPASTCRWWLPASTFRGRSGSCPTRRSCSPNGPGGSVPACPGERYAPSTPNWTTCSCAARPGYLGLAIDPAFAQNRRIYTCQGHGTVSSREAQVIAWTLDAGTTTLTRVADPLVGGLLRNDSGRHGGCRLRVGPDGALWITTGDGAFSGTSQDLSALGGKVLRVNRFTGAGRRATRSRAAATPTCAGCSPPGTATSRASRSDRAPTNRGRSNTAPPATTRSTAWCLAATTGGTRGPDTTSRSR